MAATPSATTTDHSGLSGTACSEYPPSRNNAPASMGTFVPHRSDNRAATRANDIIAKLAGSWHRAASRIGSPYPAPWSGSACSNCVVMRVLP